MQVDVYQESDLSPLLFAISVDKIKKCAKEGLINKILYADDYILISVSKENLTEKFLT